MTTRSRETLTLFVASFALLYLEMILIRWVSTEISIFAYLQNTVLVVCFLGFGFGCFSSEKPVEPIRTLLAVTVLVLLLAVPYSREALATISLSLSMFQDFVVWHQAKVPDSFTAVAAITSSFISIFCLMVLIWEAFVPFGRLIGRLLDEHPNTILAYSVNIAGSLIGIWAFILLSALHSSPLEWMLLFSLVFFALLVVDGKRSAVNTFLLLIIPVGAYFASSSPKALEAVWSPYQKLELIKGGGEHPFLAESEYDITVNNSGYQSMLNYNPAWVAENPQLRPEDESGLSQYDIPLLLHPNPKKVLLVGAGSGNDAAGALRQGAEEIFAVDIDPAITDMGVKYHPEHPYTSPKVTIINDDARAVFAKSNDKYDLIIFGLLDSHTMTSMTNARLDHYVYTVESLRKAKTLLKDDGLMSLAFCATRPFIADRIQVMLEDVFKQKPLSFRVDSKSYCTSSMMYFVGSVDRAKTLLEENEELKRFIAKWKEDTWPFTYTTKPITDDWPYLYLEAPSIPSLFYALAILMLGLLWYGTKRVGMKLGLKEWRAHEWHFFFLGAAFLLLEVHTISKAAVVFGNTWTTSAFIISAIMVMILVANLVRAKFPRIPIPLVYAGLLGSCLMLYFVDIAAFAGLPLAQRIVVVSALSTLPVLFSGIAFVAAFDESRSKDIAFGANLFGSVVGGLLQSITFVIGVGALTLVVAGLYAAAFLTRRA